MKKGNRILINNQLFMDNVERYRNVCLGYSIQAQRIMHFIQNPNNCNKQSLEKAIVIMKTILLELKRMERGRRVYLNHIFNHLYCKMKIHIHAKRLQKVIADTDELINGGVKNESQH